MWPGGKAPGKFSLQFPLPTITSLSRVRKDRSGHSQGIFLSVPASSSPLLGSLWEVGGVARGRSSTHIPVHPHLLSHHGGLHMAFFSCLKGLRSAERPLTTLTFSLLSQIQFPSSKDEGGSFLALYWYKGACIKVRNTRSTLHSGIGLQFVSTGRCDFQTGASPRSGPQQNGLKTPLTLTLGGSLNNGTQEDHTISSCNTRALSSITPPMANIRPHRWSRAYKLLSIRGSSCF